MIRLKIDKIDDIIKDHHYRICVYKGKSGRASNLIDLVKKKANARGRNSNKKLFYKQLLTDLNLPLGKCLITGTPDEHKKFIDYYNANFGAELANESFLNEIGKIFYYDSYDKWEAYSLAKSLNVSVCPYCNRQYTFTIDKTLTGKGVRPHFDHFYDKARHPYLSLSFYNLIPSCYICNSTLKGTEKFDIDSHLHPYKEGFDERIKFSIKPYTVNFINGKASTFKIKYKVNAAKNPSNKEIRKILRSSNSFRIIPLYNKHCDYVAEIIQKSIAYNEDHFNNLFNDYNGTLFGSIEDVKKMVLSNFITEDELGNRVLAKLTKDIAEELGII